MATKAELEVELAALRKQLDERPASAPDKERAAKAATDSDETDTPKIETESATWEKEVTELLAEFEDFPHKKTVLLALGVFTLGYLIGRSR